MLNAPEKLFGFQFVFTGGGAPQQANVQDDNITTPRLYAIQHVCEVIEVKLIADRNEDVARACSDCLWGQFAFRFQVELVHLHVTGAHPLAVAL